MADANEARQPPEGMRCARYVTLINSQFERSGELFARTSMYAHLINYVSAMCDVTMDAFCRQRRRCARQEGVALPIASYRVDRERKDNRLVTDSPAMFSRARDTCNLFRAARDETHLASDSASSLRIRNERGQQTNADRFALINHCSVILSFYRSG